jgi:hypothetical protein
LSGSFGWEGKDSGSRVSPGSTKVCVAISVAKKEADVDLVGLDEVVEVVFQPCESSGVPALLPPKPKAALVKFLEWDEKKFEIEIAKGQEKEKTRYSCRHPRLDFAKTILIEDAMAAEGVSINGTTPAERHAIGISFGNSNSSIAYTTIEDKAEVIANEDGGMYSLYYEASVDGN